jgi:MFS family permease
VRVTQTRFIGPSSGRSRVPGTDDSVSKWGLAATVGCVVAAVLPVFMTGGLAVQITEDLGFGEAALGLAVAGFFAAGALTSVLLGKLSQRIGPGRAVRWAGVGSGICLLAIAAGARSLGALAAILAFGGVANAACQPGANMLMSRGAPPGRQGLLLGLKMAGIPISTLLSGLAVPAIALTVGWRWAYVGTGLLAFVCAALVPPMPPAAARRRQEGAPPEARLRALVILSASLALGAAGTGSMGAFMVQGGVDAGLAEGVAGYLLAVGSAGSLLMYLFMGARADRKPGRELQVSAAMLAFGATCMLGLAVEQPLLYLLSGPIAFSVGWGWPGLFNLAVVKSSPSSPGAATGITQTGAYVGSVLGPVLFGFLAEEHSFSWAWIVAAVCAVGSSFGCLAGQRALDRA